MQDLLVISTKVFENLTKIRLGPKASGHEFQHICICCWRDKTSRNRGGLLTWQLGNYLFGKVCQIYILLVKLQFSHVYVTNCWLSKG